MKVISFGTAGKYGEYILRLEESLKEHRLQYDLEIIPPKPRFKWEAAFGKPSFILDKLEKYGQVLWLDADSYVLGKIELPEGEWDVAFQKHWRPNKAVTCCAIGFNLTEASRDFLARWHELCDTKAKDIVGTEHERMSVVRETSPELIQAELTPCLKDKLIVNYKCRKEKYV